MKVYIFTKNPFPIGMAATNRITCYAKGLIANGIDCEIVVVNRTERIDINKQYNFCGKGFFENIPFQYISNSVIRSDNFIKRRFDDFIDYIKTLFFCIKSVKTNDILLCYISSFMFVLPLILISKIKKYRIIKELCEFPHGTINDSLYHRFLTCIELNFIFPFFNGFIAISEELEKLARKYGKRNAIILRIPILVELEKCDDKYLHGKPYIFHCGTMTERKDGIVSTMKAFAIAVRKLNYSIDFIIAGPKSSNFKDLELIVNSNDLNNNVVFLGQLPKNEIYKYQNGAALAILNKNDNIQNRCGFSTKLGEILLSETAVITTTVGEANYYLKDGISAYIVDPHKPELIAQKIVQAFQDVKTRNEIAFEGKNVAASEFNCQIQMRKFSCFCQE